MDKIFYNEGSAARLGWTPYWFGCESHGEELVAAIEEFQKHCGITVDGCCGPTTYRRIYTHRVATLEDHAPMAHKNNSESFIVYNSDYFPIEWPKVKLYFESGGLKLRSGWKKSKYKRDPKFFVCHWDVCLSAESCYRVLQKRGISVHFSIDNDGTIYQFMDMNDIAWHAGGKTWNERSLGVEISNAYYTKYQSWYESRDFGPRPIITDAHVHGKKLPEHLGFYPVQIEALKALMKAVHKCTGIPLQAPLDRAGNTNTKVSKKASEGRFEGFVSHYHLTKRKIDCAGLDIKKLLEEL